MNCNDKLSDERDNSTETSSDCDNVNKNTLNPNPSKT